MKGFEREDFRFKGNFIEGTWKLSEETDSSAPFVSPANAEWTGDPVFSSFKSLERTVACARSAYEQWSKTSLEERMNLLRDFAGVLESSADRLAQVIAVETGKPYAEAQTEAGALSAKIAITIEHGLKLVEKQSFEFGQGNTGEIMFRPRGVLSVIGPFNFPVHLSHGHIVPALLMGNVCILKPSERTPYSAQFYMDLFSKVAFPQGVLQMIHGNARLSTRLINHSGVDGVLATCSYEVGSKIQGALGEKPEKMVALEMGGKNAALVWEADDIDRLADDMIRSSFLTTGQRCTALSRLYVKRSMLDELAQRVHEKSKELVVNQPFAEDPRPFMGPLISESSRDTFLKYDVLAANEGAESIMRPKALEGIPKKGSEKLPQGYYVSPSIRRVSKWDADSVYQNHEIFGPDLFFCPIDELEEGIAAVNSSKYGLSFSCYIKEESAFDKVADQIEAGLIYWNRPTVGASGRLPFGGWKQSGNHRPAGLFAIYASTQIQARIK